MVHTRRMLNRQTFNSHLGSGLASDVAYMRIADELRFKKETDWTEITLAVGAMLCLVAITFAVVTAEPEPIYLIAVTQPA